MKLIDYEIQLQSIEKCLTIRYGIMPDTGVHHKKKSWLRWFYSKKVQQKIRNIKEEEILWV